jgi:maleylpyruvate isomerase
MRLHGYWRSSAAYRVRIALNLKGLTVDHAFHHLRRNEQNAELYRAMNPQGQLPTLELADGRVLTQSLAIIQWLDETYPHPTLLHGDAWLRSRILAFSLVIAADTHPLQNLKVLNRLRAMGHDEAEVRAWAASIIREGLEACERLAQSADGPFVFGAAPSLADLCLVPQLYNARRFGVGLDGVPRLLQAETAALALDAFRLAAPEAQPDAET